MGSPGESDDGGVKFDLESSSAETAGGGDGMCNGGGGGSGGDGGTPGCTKKAPPNSFEATVQWSWDAPGERESAVIPLVGNFTDDNADGKIEPCADIPDIVVTVTSSFVSYSTGNPTPGHIHVLDGASGAVHFTAHGDVDATITPAIGDIDGDGLLEIVSVTLRQNLIAFEHDGALKWTSTDWWESNQAIHGTLALADLDNDGDVEILAGTSVYDHDGKRVWIAPTQIQMGIGNGTTAADLDGDGDLEVVLGHAAYHHDASEYYLADVPPGYPQVANLDDDPEPEVLITTQDGLTMLEHTGQVKYRDLQPTGDYPDRTTWIRPAAIHDFDGNGTSEYAMSSASNYTVYNGDGTIVWSAGVQDQSGSAAGTAFDFLGDAKAEAMYADEYNFFIFDDKGAPYFAVPRSSRTVIEYPIVADMDNDGSAEIAVVSYGGPNLTQTAPTIQVIRDKEDRWIQARRIWNQHTYHVTNVNENGTIPQFEAPNWETLNTFRTNAQIDDGGVCKPVPPE